MRDVTELARLIHGGAPTAAVHQELARDWYDDHRNLARLYRWLTDDRGLGIDTAHFLEEPWAWTAEWDELAVFERDHGPVR